MTSADCCLTERLDYVTWPTDSAENRRIARVDRRKTAPYGPKNGPVRAQKRPRPPLREGQLRGVTAAAHGLDQRHAELQAARQDAERRLFRAQAGGLRRDHAAIGHGSGLVLVEREFFRFDGGGHRGVLDDGLLLQHAQGDDVVLDLLEAK